MTLKRMACLFVLVVLVLTSTVGCSSGKPASQPASQPAGQQGEQPSSQPSSQPAGQPATTQSKTFKLGHIGSLENEYHLMALRFKEEVEKRTGGRYVVQIYPARQLGGDREIIEAMQFGNVDCGVVTSSPMVNFVPALGVLDLPYVFKDWDHIERFAKSQALQELLKEGEKANLINLAVLPRGFRSITNSKHPVKVPADLKDLKLRVIESPVFIDTFRLFGGTVIAMAAGEVYTALQQKTIDAQENTPAVNIYERFYEVQKYFSMTQHMSAWGIVAFSKSTWDKIPAEDQKLIKEAALAAQETQTRLQRESEAGFIKQLKDKGMQINDDVDRAAFARVTKPVIDAWVAKNGDKYVKAIQALE